ncbi:hypothetical protein OROGR_007511 [Orobanche gracilis]
MSSTKKLFTLKSSDGEAFQVEEAVALQMPSIKPMIENGSADSGIDIPIKTGRILAMVIEYCRKHVEASGSDLRQWDTNFLKVDNSTLLGLVLAAQTLGIRDLLNRTCQAVASVMEGKNPNQVRESFKDYLFPEEKDI